MSNTRLPLWIAANVAVFLFAAVSYAQDDSPVPSPPLPEVESPIRSGAESDDDTPVLPDTDVIGEPPAPGDDFPVTDFVPTTVPSDDPFPSPLQGTIFGSPIADGYRADSATSATRLNVPILRTPATVNVVPEDLFEQQEAIRFDEVLRNVPAAISLGNSLQPDALLLRGFEVRTRDFRKNGFLDPTPAPRDLSNVQRIEILKGPATILYGSGQPAGVVNFITEKPLAYRQDVIDFQYGSFDLRRGTIDSTGPIGGSDQFFYRINFAYEDTGGFRDFYFDDRTFVAPAFTWVVSDDTVVTWEFEYLRDRQRFDSGTVVLGGQFLVPIENFLGEPSDFFHFREYRSTFFVTHHFNDDTYLRFGGYSTWGSNPTSHTVPVSPAGGSLLVRQRRNIDPFQENYHSLIADLYHERCIGGVKHKLLLGTEQGWFNSTDFTAEQSNPATDPLIIDALNPVYGGAPGSTPLVFNSNFTQNRHGIYFQDLIEVTPKLSALLGVRYDMVRQKFARSLTPIPEVRNDQNFHRGTPRAGIVYEPIDELLSFYAMFAESFDTPPGGARIDSTPLLPEDGTIWEGGVKAKLLDNLSLTASGFHITKRNVIVDDFATLTTTQVGKVRSQGMEFQLIGDVTDRWQVVANYAYVDARITEDAVAGRVGNLFRNSPLNSGSLWTTYTFLDQAKCDACTFGTALGLVGMTDRAGDVDDSFRLPGFTRFDAGLFCKRGPISANLYFENIGDIEYYTGSESSLAVFPGAPFNVRGTVGLTY